MYACLSVLPSVPLGMTTQPAGFCLQTFLPDQQRLVLNVNTVVEVLLHVYQHGDWTEALVTALPQRLRGVGGRKKTRLDKKRYMPKPLSLCHPRQLTTAYTVGHVPAFVALSSSCKHTRTLAQLRPKAACATVETFYTVLYIQEFWKNVCHHC